jgi:hypothetical protein
MDSVIQHKDAVMFKLKIFLVLSLFLMVIFPAQAQDATPDINAPGNFPITYNETVNQTITAGGFYDTYRIQAIVGDTIVVYMTASNGLAPYVAILSPGSDTLATSIAGEVNGMVTVEWTVEETGIYTIVATRVDDEFGTTTGDYELQVRNANPSIPTIDPMTEAVFQCQDFEAVNVVSLDFGEDAGQTDQYRISVYGFDGLQPVIRIYIPSLNLLDCSQDGRFMVGDVVSLPNEMSLTVPESDANAAARLHLTGIEDTTAISLTVGAARRTPGRFALVIEGLQIGEDQDIDTITLMNGALAAASPLMVYMVHAQNSRVDPFIFTTLADGTQLTCDDAGRRTCMSEVPSFRDLGFTFVDGNPLVGTRFDAGVTVAPAWSEQLNISFTSYDYRTTGAYALVVIGQLPAVTP